MVEFLRASGLAPEGTTARWTPLTGGVSSDLWRVDLPQGSICVKAALATLRVADTWEAPAGRNAVEVDWLRFVAAHAPRVVPEVLAADPTAGVFAMGFLDRADHPVWKSELVAGRRRGGGSGGGKPGRAAPPRQHTHADRRQELARRFATDDGGWRPRRSVTSQCGCLGVVCDTGANSFGSRVIVCERGVSLAAWTPWTCGRRRDAQPGVMVRAGVVSWPSVASSASSSPVRSTGRRNSSGM
jgi:hypothetical protein